MKVIRLGCILAEMAGHAKSSLLGCTVVTLDLPAISVLNSIFEKTSNRECIRPNTSDCRPLF